MEFSVSVHVYVCVLHRIHSSIVILGAQGDCSINMQLRGRDCSSGLNFLSVIL